MTGRAPKIACLDALSLPVSVSATACKSLPNRELPDDPPGQTNAAGTPEPSLPGAAPPQQKNYGTVSGRVVDQNGNAVAGTNTQIKSSLESAIQEAMSLATVVTEVRVSPSIEEIAQEEFKDLEQHRVLGIVPNFYVSYVGEVAPLTPKRKFELALKATTDPVTTMAVATIAGVNQATL